LHKKNERHIKLRGRHFNYDFIEDQNIKKYPNIDVILTQFVSGVGKKGDIINVRPSHAYNKLLLPGLADYVTPENIERYTTVKDEKSDEAVHSSPYAKSVKNIS